MSQYANNLDERLSAYLDGQLYEAEMTALEVELAADPASAARLEELASADAALGGGFAGILEEPIPERLSALLSPRETAEVADFASARAKREQARRLPAWASWRAFAAIAATLALAVFGVAQLRQQPVGDPAMAAMAAALNNTPSGQVAQLKTGGTLSPRLTFSAKDGRWCREYVTTSESGVACKGSGGWRIEGRVAGSLAPDGRGYEAAEGPGTALDGTYARLGAGDPLAPAAEKALIAKGWE